ncbi:hypothetical protein GCL60_12355 [Silvanigrella paludirubra]|uniref:Uncharacterized protein n=1 Tax=Silvanigrella paludirubra TaxID=2499159 RepID=A0A6N6VWY7_9BACT|nr:hypothetical protein [Silvanigrella paludirubra]KAB8037957.1 hypothetical protein GCL60_12355 [Silvanigrella paludirubra]
MTQKLNNSQGSNPLKGNNQPVKKFTPALLFSGLFVAISFTVMLIPLAIFNVSQVAAILGKRVAFYLMLAVSFGFILFGNLFGSYAFVITGVFVLIAIPFFMSAIALREKKRSWVLAAIIHFIPALLIFGIFTFGLNKAQFDEFKNNIQQNQALVSPVTPPNSSLAEKKGDETLNKSTEKTTIDENSKQVLSDNYSKILAVLEDSGQMKEFQELINYTPWQRLAFLVYGAGSLTFLVVLLICFANVVFVDFGFEQIERLRAIVNYVRRNSASFPGQLLNSLLALPMVRANRLQTPILITQHTSTQNHSENNKSNFLSFLWKPLRSKNQIHWQGYSFKFEGKSPWGLRDFALPLPLAISAIAVVGGIAFWYGNHESVLTLLKNAPFAPLIAIASVLSFIMIAIVALQGMFTIYKRLPMFVGLALMILVLYLSKYTNAPYSVIALCGAVGLLDYVYDWRGKKV